ncbi:MAG: coth protein-domain-containing protein [Linnemannia gamsii]|nr:MAG: coth protein-domain-containing protein [Linnemannia gamsii]
MKIAIASMLALSAVAQAALVKFNVIAPGQTSVQVTVNGQTTALTCADAAALPVFTGSVETGADKKYKYVAGGQAEAFERDLPTGASTYNDFFDRPITYANIPELPWPIEKNPQWTRLGPKQSIFDTNYIPTIFVNGEANQVKTLVEKVGKEKIPVTIHIVLANEVKTLSTVDFGVHGSGKKNNNDKQSWNFRLAKGEIFQQRSFFKLRHQEEDPTQIREKLYADIGRAMGSYTNEANMIRLFINGDGFGTFNLLDDTTDFSYIDAMFHAGNPPATHGALFDGASGASFAWFPKENNGSYYSWIDKSQTYDAYTEVDPLALAWLNTDKTNDAAIAEFEKRLDVDQHIRLMVLEYLTGNWDGYWEQQTNDGLYRDTTQNDKWYYLAQDFDATFGVNIPSIDETFPEWSYTKYPTAFPGAVMINGLLQNPTRKADFENYLKKTVEVLFNNVTLGNRILKYHDFILPDLKWDRSIIQRSPGKAFKWTFEQVTENLHKGVVSPANGPNTPQKDWLGGANIGLLQWIERKSNAVAKEFSITITPTPVGPPSGSKPPTPGGNPSTPEGNKPDGGNASNNGNAAGHVLPQALVTIALFGASALALLA